VTVVKLKSSYSYLVDMGNRQVRHVHANKIRKFIARVHGCGVISDSDVDFGSVLQPVRDACDSKPSERVSADRLTHLNAEQRDDLLSVLDEYAICFRDRPGLYTGAVHRIETTAEFKPKRMRAYRVPEVFKPDVEKQIGELLDMGLIRPSVSPMTSPIVCVAKKMAGVRLAMDMDYLLADTRGWGRPVENCVCDAWWPVRMDEDAIRFEKCRGYICQGNENSFTPSSYFC